MGGGGGAQRPVWGGNELKKTGARSARARTRGQNPLVVYSYLKSENSQDYAQKPQRNCTFMNSASAVENQHVPYA